MQAACRAIPHVACPDDLVTASLHAEVLRRFPLRRGLYVLRVLTAGELAVIGDLNDALIIARIKRMPLGRLRGFDGLLPADRRHERLYRIEQLRWLGDETYLLGTRLGRQPTHRELLDDFMTNHHGLRFRAYFAMKHPGKMRAKASTPAA